MKIWIQLLLLTFLDFVIIWFWVKRQDPDPSISIGILLVVPMAIIINLVIAGIFYIAKRQYSKTFLINSLISAVIMYNLFIAGINRHQRLKYEDWSFQIKDTTFIVTHSKLDSTFDVAYRTYPNSSSGIVSGHFLTKNNINLLTTDTSLFIIKNNFFFGFRGVDSFRLTKHDY